MENTHNSESIAKIKHYLKDDSVIKDNLKYYYLNKDEYCCDIDLKVMFDDTEIYHYIEPIKKLAEYYKDIKSNYYEELYKKYKDTKFDAPIFLKDFDYDMDEILLQYMKCQKNSNILIIWPISGIESIDDLKKSKFYSLINSNGKILIVVVYSLLFSEIS